MRENKLPLRTVLENFINLVETKKGGKEEQYEQEFQDLKKLTESLKNDLNFSCNEGEEECNRRKNRYKDILPYDRTRVVLRPYPGIPGSDYINANYIRGASGSRAYIASQGPLPHTVADFWRMVVECDVQVIIMASNETEGGKHKCECYWVENQGEEKQFGNVQVTFVKSRQVCPDFLVRTFKIKFASEKNSNEERTICQFHYILWPDHGVPDTVRPLLDMVRLVRDCQASETLPVLVHCSAGCGRTGTICAIDYVWGLLRTGKLTDNLDLFGLVKEMRRQRVAMVQTREQYSLLHEAVKELFRERLKLIDSHPYENVATDGNPLSATEKESDYEELYISQEKQDTSTKTSTPTPTPSIASTPSNSLTRQPPSSLSGRSKEERDYLRRSASTSSLDNPYLPPTPSRPYKSSGMSLALSQSSLPNVPGNGSLKSSPITHSLNDASLFFTSYLSDSDLKNYRKRPPSGYSKMEKEAENIAQKLESRERERKVYSSLSTLSQRSSSASSPSSTTFNSPCITPAATPSGGNPPNSLQGVSLLSAPNPPAPPPRSRTPSPIISLRKSIEMQQNGFRRQANQLDVPRLNGDQSPEARRKSTEIVRRPSIKKLKELFEKSVDRNIEAPGHIRLSRSASSITAKSSLSIPGCDEAQPKIRRKSSIGSEENLHSKKFYEMDDQSRLQICPPPPPLKDANCIISLGKPPSMPTPSSPGARRRGMIFAPDSNTDNERKAKGFTRLDERPALPIKKSKSFRWSRQETNSPFIKSSPSRSPELPAKRSPGHNYYSLERTHPDHSFHSLRAEAFTKKHSDDFPPPKEGFKLSVYQVAAAAPDTVDAPGALNDKCEDKPFIPPKRFIGERFKNNRSTPHLSPGLQPIEPTLLPDNISNNLSSASPGAGSLRDNSYLRAQTSISNLLYDHLPSRKVKGSKDVEAPNIEEEDAMQCSFPKEYVNARVMKSAPQDNSHSPKLVYVPLPSKRNVKVKEKHDYANYDIGSKYLDRDEVRRDSVPATPDEELGLQAEAQKTSILSSKSDRSSSSDYEPMDFGERAASVDEVFETVNYELLNSKERNAKRSDKKDYSNKDFYLNRDLDSLARQVYQDCQDYLLHGTNQSPVPSLMPRNKESPERSNSLVTKGISGSIADRLLESLADLEEVKNKVSVPPHGLRNRERRDSYRQAVSHKSVNYNKLFDSHGQPLSRKSINKYEKIWFDSPKHEEKFVGPLSGGGRGRGLKDDEHFFQDFSSNLDQQMNSNNKEDLFKDKLKELQNLVSHLEQNKGVMLPDLSEEDLSSKDSGSTSSLLSKSGGHSSKSSDKNEPIYANATAIGVPTMSTTNKVDQVFDSYTKSSALANPKSPYGTIATVTHPYKPKLTNSTHSFPKTSAGNYLPSNYPKSHTATLPARPIASVDVNTRSLPGRPEGIRPSASNKHINPHNIRHDGERSPLKDSSSQTCAASGFISPKKGGDVTHNHMSKGYSPSPSSSKSPYKKLPSSSSYFKGNVASSSNRKKDSSSSKSHFVSGGNTALVEGTTVKLRRRPLVPPPPPTVVHRGFPHVHKEIPTAPPRVKRNSSVSLDSGVFCPQAPRRCKTHHNSSLV